VVAVTGEELPVLWIVSRAAALVATGMLTVTVLLGIAAGSRSASAWPRFVTQGLHRAAAVTGLVLLVVHIVTMVVDPHAELGPADVVVPFGAGYRALWTGLGTLAVDLMLLILLTTLWRHRLSPRLWRGIHLTAYAAWGLAIAHGIGAGTDAGQPLVAATNAASVGLVVAALGVRVYRDWGRQGTRYRKEVSA
jgi:sulfoxide reductase heme-binding subunit YedZ